MKLNPKSLLLWALVSIMFIAFVLGFERYKQKYVLAEAERFAELLEVHLWNFDVDTAQEYLQVIEETGNYVDIEIRQKNGSVFAKSTRQKPFWRIDDFLFAVGLEQEVVYEIPLSYRNESIGVLHATWRNRNIYTHMNVLVLLILIVSVARYIGRIAGQEQEIAERKAAEDALRISEAKWRSLVVSAPDIILTLDRDLVVTYINRGDTSYTRDAILGSKITEIFTAPNEKQGLEIFNSVLATGEPAFYEAKIIDPVSKQMRHFSARMGPIIEEDRISSVLVVVTEITKQKQAASDLEQARKDAEKANRLKTDFLANMSHEIRTPLNVILGYTSLVEKFSRQHLPENRTVYFEYIRNAGRRLMDTIQKIVDISRFHIEDFPFTPEPLCANKTVEECVTELKVLADQKKISLNYSPPAKEYWIHFDPYAFTHVLTNIVENAIKYTQEGSVDICLNQDEEMVVVTVKDSGIGIGDEYLPQIFDEFSQEEGGYSRPFEGTGLGMSLVKKFLDIGGGEIDIASQKGAGTTVTLKWPATSPSNKDSAIQEGLAPSRDNETTQERKTIIVVEDDASTQAFMRTALSDKYDVHVADNSADVLALLEKITPALILMDLSLKDGEDGTTLTKKIRAKSQFADVPIVALTAHALDADRENALAAGCNDYLSKPCPLEKLLTTVDSYTQQQET